MVKVMCAQRSAVDKRWRSDDEVGDEEGKRDSPARCFREVANARCCTCQEMNFMLVPTHHLSHEQDLTCSLADDDTTFRSEHSCYLSVYVPHLSQF